MKKILLLLLLMFGLFNGYGQTQITLTFIAKDSITQTPVSLDSLYVKNLDENCDTMLYGAAPILSLLANWPVGINETHSASQGSFVLNQNYPNPFQGSTSVRKNLSKRNPPAHDNAHPDDHQAGKNHDGLLQAGHSGGSAGKRPGVSHQGAKTHIRDDPAGIIEKMRPENPPAVQFQ